MCTADKLNFIKYRPHPKDGVFKMEINTNLG